MYVHVEWNVYENRERRESTETARDRDRQTDRDSAQTDRQTGRQTHRQCTDRDGDRDGDRDCAQTVTDRQITTDRDREARERTHQMRVRGEVLDNSIFCFCSVTRQTKMMLC